MFEAKLQILRKAQERYLPEAADQAGKLGEQLSLKALQGISSALHGKTKIYQSLRVPKLGAQGKFEIDLLLVSETAVLALEVKHWGGRLSRLKGHWQQIRGNDSKPLADPVALNEQKLKALAAWLAQRGMALPTSSLHAAVVISNTQTSLDASIQKISQVLKIDDLPAYSLLTCGSPKHSWWQKKPVRPFSFKKLIDELDQLPTWDRLSLHGGKTSQGDFEILAIRSTQNELLDRKRIKSARILVSRRLIPGLFLSPKLRITDWNGRTKTYRIKPQSRLLVNLAGQNRKEEISLLNVTAFELGWKDHSYYD